MDLRDRIVYLVFAGVIVLLLLALVDTRMDNRRMRRVLVDRTLVELDRRYERERLHEERATAELQQSLSEAMNELWALEGLGRTERALIERARGLTERILEAGTVKGLSF